MKILFITNMYPVRDYIYFGIHVKEQIEAIENIFDIKKEIYFINGRASKWNYLKSIFKINSLIRANNYDIVHIHFGLSGLFLLFNPFLKIPVVLTIHGTDINSNKGLGMLRFITKLVVKRVHNVIAMNDSMVSKLTMYRKKIVKIPCGIDINQFKEIFVQKNPLKIIIGFPGNKKRQEKNFQLFLKIVEKMKDITEIEVIEFHDMTREEVVKNLNKIDLLLLTSTSEGSPQIIKEAMACNKPIVSTDVGDIRYLLKDVKKTFVINSFDPKNFISPIEEIIKLSMEKRKTNGRNELLKMHLDAENVAKSIYRLYEKLI
ncbi:glycosyltransferase family 4 protein [Mucilaginibacter arboris]|uniref:Glycosyltransferase n=1 Tax=Mucilaginibacter arboris TaxID=2682090 RepID=A0A7K1SYD3_9SPHI|nr:glycosyltransferase family 4 protein [Mucilaginibacter arboris]MVN22040.1 glycosyltransferase [Mucilaginibacter arboris]